MLKFTRREWWGLIAGFFTGAAARLLTRPKPKAPTVRDVVEIMREVRPQWMPDPNCPRNLVLYLDPVHERDITRGIWRN